jgi:hypothetical protein
MDGFLHVYCVHFKASEQAINTTQFIFSLQDGIKDLLSTFRAVCSSNLHILQTRIKIIKAEMIRLSGFTEEIKQKTVLTLHKVRVASLCQITSTILSDTFFSYSTCLLTA